MRPPLSTRIIAAALLIALSPAEAQTKAGTIDFDRKVHPILASRCLACHSKEKRSGGLSLAAYRDVLDGGRSGATVRPGQSASSLLISRVTGESEPRMPIGQPSLTPEEVAILRTWIDEGARSTPTGDPAKPKWEAPLSLERPKKPPVEWKGWDSTIDRFVAGYLSTAGVTEPTLVSDGLFARRAYLDIWGLLPPPGDLRDFVADTSGSKRRKLVDRLLSDDQKYAEHWISYWNDLLRNEDGVNYYSETASRKSITKWLFSALEENRPYDEWVERLLNPDSKTDPDGFLIGVNWRGEVNASQVPAMQAAQNTAQIFLGINLKCNSCHDSFINRWKLRDAYSLAAYFSADATLQLHRCDVAQQDRVGPKFLFPELDRPPASEALDNRRKAAAEIFTDPRNGRMPRTLVNRIWQRLLGHGIVANPDEMDDEPWSPEMLDALAEDFVKHKYDLKYLIRSIVSSRAYQMPAVARAGEDMGKYAFRGPEVRRLTAEQFADAIGAITGEWPVYTPRNANPATPGELTREWRVIASPLTRALGRPIRDQVYSTRETRATTLQALEVVNGDTLTHRLLRGARRMLHQLPPAPKPLFDKPYAKGEPREFDIDITGAKRLWLLVQDTGSYSPEKVEAAWKGVELKGPPGTAPLPKPMSDTGLRDAMAEGRIPVKTPSMLVYDLGNGGFTKLRGTALLENKEISSALNPRLRFLIFGEQPDLDQLSPVAAGTPLPSPPVPKSSAQAVDQIFHYALGRPPTSAEKQIAESALNPLSPEALADLLWAVVTKPEFQLVY